MLETSFFPQVWKLAKITTLPKPGKNPIVPQNRRPISILNTMAKAFQKILIKRIQKIVTQKRLLPNQQIGFRQHHSTIHTATRVAKCIITGYSNKKHTAALYMDLSPHILNTQANRSRISFSLLENNTKLFEQQEIPCSPGRAWETHKAQCSHHYSMHYTQEIRRSSFTLYAYDTVVYAKDRKLEEYWAKWAIKINASKSTLLIFSKSIKNDIKKIKLLKIYPLIKANRLPTKTKIMLYKTMIRIVMLYGAEIWRMAALTHTRLLQRTQNKILRSIPHLKKNTNAKDLHEKADIDTIFTRIQDLNEKFYQKTQEHKNPFVRRLGKYTTRYKCKLIWCAPLFVVAQWFWPLPVELHRLPRGAGMILLDTTRWEVCSYEGWRQRPSATRHVPCPQLSANDESERYAVLNKGRKFGWIETPTAWLHDLLRNGGCGQVWQPVRWWHRHRQLCCRKASGSTYPGRALSTSTNCSTQELQQQALIRLAALMGASNLPTQNVLLHTILGPAGSQIILIPGGRFPPVCRWFTAASHTSLQEDC
ncbi:hypothetical protein PR048_008604 [Dryococelus australis]|uniref:Reverse transcriptase domain-containing protein n=1 Tax=Dryococelus australis TaxID=614101 RepID=A0ABQ9HXJ9_9NEOP|nr:hypothetical protein PR048_008604 [Dryococelus australis]